VHKKNKTDSNSDNMDVVFAYYLRQNINDINIDGFVYATERKNLESDFGLSINNNSLLEPIFAYLLQPAKNMMLCAIIALHTYTHHGMSSF